MSDQFPQSFCKLVGTGGGFIATSYSLQTLYDLCRFQATRHRGNPLQIAVAASGKTYVGDTVAVHLNVD